MLQTVTVIIIKIIKIFRMDAYLDPILSIRIPSVIPPMTSPKPKATIPKRAYEYLSAS